MSSSSRKITYSSDFKLEVLIYYFKHGGDDKFGLKKKTAGHFNIDKKTISRMLNNPEMVKRARRLLAKRISSNSSSSSSKTSSSSSSSSSSSKSKAKQRTVGKASGAISSTSTSVSTSGVKSGVSSSSSGPDTTTTTTTTTTRVPAQGVRVIDLPEDPDYSILKRSINASINGVANLTKLLLSSTDEVRQLLLNECDLILECKVCRNLFRSVVNFLAHKRIYCQDNYSDVKTLFHKDTTQGITSQSGTVVVEPEPPPPTTPPPTTPQGTPRGIDIIAERLAIGKKLAGSGSDGVTCSSAAHTGSAGYYERLQAVNQARDKLSQDCSVVLEDIRGVTNARLQTFLPPSSPLSASTTLAAPSATPPHMSQLLEEVSRKATGVSVVLGERGQVIKTAPGDVDEMEIMKPTGEAAGKTTGAQELICTLCNTRFATAKTLSVHQRSHHGLDRYIYSCPICHSSFFTMWGIVKHLEKTHKKSKHHIDRLKKVILKNLSKKRFFPTSQLAKEEEEEEEEAEAEGGGKSQEERRGKEERMERGGGRTSRMMDTTTTTTTTTTTATTTTTTTTTSSRRSAVIKLNSKREQASSSSSGSSGGCSSISTPSPEHRCDKCERRFMTPQALISHKKFCSLQQMKPQPVILPKSPLNPRLRSETPEKRIAIQIRKDYKKSMSPNLLEDDERKESEEVATKVESIMAQLCHVSSLACIPCGRSYRSITTLKRHLSVHSDWTRYACRRCEFRSYNRYELIRHAVTQHGVTESAASALTLNDVKFGPVKYFLTSEDKTDTPDLEEDEGANMSNGTETKAFTGIGDQIDGKLSSPDEQFDSKETKPSLDQTEEGVDAKTKIETNQTQAKETKANTDHTETKPVETNYVSDQTDLSVKKPDRTYSKRKTDQTRARTSEPAQTETKIDNTEASANGHLDQNAGECHKKIPELGTQGTTELQDYSSDNPSQTGAKNQAPEMTRSARRRLAKKRRLLHSEVGQNCNGSHSEDSSGEVKFKLPQLTPIYHSLPQCKEDGERERKAVKIGQS